MKMELIRIEIFQNHLIKHRMEIWNNEDFYQYWEGLEQGRSPNRPNRTLHTNDLNYTILNIL